LKLYATSTSERASKGQGGNEFLDINITNEQGHLLAYIRVIPRENDIPALYFEDLIQHVYLVKNRGEWDVIEEKEKGKKQKTA